MEPNENHPRAPLGPLTITRHCYSQDVSCYSQRAQDEYWQSVCPTNKDDPSQKAKKSQNSDWRYAAKLKTDEQREKVLLAQRIANEIQKETDLMEADDNELKKEVKKMKSAADEILKSDLINSLDK